MSRLGNIGQGTAARLAVAVGTLTLAAALLPAQTVQPVQFLTNFDQAAAIARKYGYPLLLYFPDPMSKKMDTDVFGDKRIVDMCKTFVPVRLPPLGPIAGKLSVDRVPTVVFLDPLGEKIDEIVGYGKADIYVRVMAPVVEKSERRILELAEKELTSKNASTAAAALARIGQLRSKQVEDVLLGQLRREDAPDAVKKVALESLGRNGMAPEELVSFLNHKSTTLSAAAAAGLQAMGPAAVSHLFDGLASEFADRRAASHKPAAAITKYPKARTATFWKSGPEEERKVVLDDWRNWWDKNKPPMSTKN
jgi:hypothetical protein